MARQKKTTSEPKPIEIPVHPLTSLFEEWYRVFEASGFDTTAPLGVAEIQIAHAGYNYAKEKGEPYASYHYDWRSFLEYALRRIPKDDLVLRELLLERLRYNWRVTLLDSRTDQDRRYHVQFLQRVEHTLGRVMKETVNNVFGELRAYQVIKGPKLFFLHSGLIMMPDGTTRDPNEPLEGTHDFGTVKDGVLRWTEDLNQLAWAFSMCEDELGYSNQKPYTITKMLQGSGKIELGRKRSSYASLRTYLEKIRAEDFDVPIKDFVPDASRVILTLFKKT